MACCGDVPTLETLAAVHILRKELPQLSIRVVNVVDLMRLQPDTEHPHGLPDREFDAIFTQERPVIFAYHGYPALIHRLTYNRANHDNFHVRGYQEEGTTTTPFDMVMRNDLDRFHLVTDVLERVPGLGSPTAELHQWMVDARLDARRYGREHGEAPPEIADWQWDPDVVRWVLQSVRAIAVSWRCPPNALSFDRVRIAALLSDELIYICSDVRPRLLPSLLGLGCFPIDNTSRWRVESSEPKPPS
jgi:hypothetical protein